jgi:hypothetical protein
MYVFGMRDRDVRMAVRDWLGVIHAGDTDTRVVEEMGVWSGTVRVDMAVINGEITGIELKSDRDTLDRLPLQAEIYNKVFDRVIIVVGSKHAKKAYEKVPSWWGFTTADIVSGKIELKIRRKPKRNPSRDPYLVAQLLWKSETLDVLRAVGMDKGCRTKSVKFLHQKLCSELSMKDLSFHVRCALKRRPDWLGKDMTNKLDVPVDTILNPGSQVARL